MIGMTWLYLIFYQRNGYGIIPERISLDYRRFQSDSILECFKLERDAIKEVTPQIPVTTNLMGFYKPLDYQKWGKEMDFISWDNYPQFGAPPAEIAMSHDMMRGLKHDRHSG